MALKLSKEALPSAKQEHFNEFLKDNRFETLRKIVLSLATDHSVAANNLAEESENYPQYPEAAMAELGKARRYLHFLDVLKEITALERHSTTTNATLDHYAANH